MSSSSLETFERALKDAVQSKRLSVSTMKEIRDLALKNMHNDTQVVSILYRTHKTLSPAHKIHSLYVFDSLSRAAKHQVDKEGLTGDVNSDRGNCATFLLKVAGVLDGLFQDMAFSSASEPKEKVKKILDIWVKSNTFPSAVLARLQKVVKESKEKDSNKVNTTQASIATVDPRPHSHSQPSTTPPQAPSAATTPIASAEGMQATLLALLTQAASAVTASNGQTTANIPAIAPPTQPEPLALLQQLTQAASAGTNHPTQPIPVPVSLVPSSAPSNAVPPVTAPVGGPSQPMPYYRDDRDGFARKESQFDKYGGPNHGRDFHDDRRDSRGPYRGGYKNDFRGDHRGGYRGAVRGRGRGRWDDHDRRADRGRDQEWGPSSRYRSGRSRSPAHARFGRNDSPQADTPPQGTPVFRMPDVPDPTRGEPEAGKDEFGRDLRPSSPPDDVSAPPSELRSSYTEKIAPPLTAADISYPAVADQTAAAPAPIPSVVHSPSLSTSPMPGQGLESIDLSTFDLTAASSWEALAQAWKVTNGYMPQQEELMQYIMAANIGMANQGNAGNQYNQQGNDGWSDSRGWENRGSWGGRGRGRSRGRGRGRGRGYGEYGYGNGRGRHVEDQGTDALTLTGGDDDSGYAPQWQDQAINNNSEPDLYHDNGTISSSPVDGAPRTGRMQRIGDKWVFVREGAAGSGEA